MEFITASPAWHPSPEAFVFPFWCLPQCVCGDGHNALRALLRSKTRCKLQCLVRQGSQVEAWLIGITKPGTAWHGQHLGKTGSKLIRSGNEGELTLCNRNGCTVPNSSPLQQLNSCRWIPPSSKHTWDTSCFQLSLKLHMAWRGTLKYYQDNRYSNWGTLKLLPVKAKINNTVISHFLE